MKRWGGLWLGAIAALALGPAQALPASPHHPDDTSPLLRSTGATPNG
ncbi:MAG: hypothetical protein ACUVSQ_12180 [Pseudanabaenaceae cyanobacterium]